MVNKIRKIFCLKRTHRYCQMQFIDLLNIRVVADQFCNISFCIFLVCKVIGYIYLPVGKGLIDCTNPFSDTCFSRINFLTSTYETNYNGPVFSKVK